MKKLLLLGLLCLTISGCVVLLTGEGEMGIAANTEWKVFHRAHPNPLNNQSEIRINSIIVEGIFDETVSESDTPDPG